jgi:hypothetical protein
MTTGFITASDGFVFHLICPVTISAIYEIQGELVELGDRGKPDTRMVILPVPVHHSSTACWPTHLCFDDLWYSTEDP